MDTELRNFLDLNKKRKIVAVQGLGFVGAAMSIVIANAKNEDYAVIGIDLPVQKGRIKKLNKGKFPIESADPKIQQYYQNAITKNNFFATYDDSAFAYADVIVVDVNLDVDKTSDSNKNLNDYDVDLTGFKEAIKTIGANCKEDALVLVETTVPPGTCEKIVAPILKNEFERRELPENFKIGHSYERVMPGPDYVDSIQNFYRVYSGIDEESAQATRDFLKTIINTKEYPLTELKNTTASETSKVLENSFRAMNIAFIQEWTEFAESAGIDLHEIIGAIRKRPTHKNIMGPGLGVGGYCLTKDPLFANWSSKALFNANSLKLSETAVRVNDQMPLHTFKRIQKYFNNNLKEKQILILGLSYLKNVGDTRNTPVELLYDKLSKEDLALTIHDPFINYWPERNLYIFSEKMPLDNFDAIVMGTPHDYYFNDGNLNDLLKRQGQDTVIFDPHGAIPANIINQFSNLDFQKIGSGDEQ